MARSRQRSTLITASGSAGWRWPGDCSICRRDVEEIATCEREGGSSMTTQVSIDKAIRRIAIVGTGVIGASWSAFYLAHGFDVVATDPSPDAEARLRHYVDDAWP